jgi:flagellar basal body-associated protein FliL
VVDVRGRPGDLAPGAAQELARRAVLDVYATDADHGCCGGGVAVVVVVIVVVIVVVVVVVVGGRIGGLTGAALLVCVKEVEESSSGNEGRAKQVPAPEGAKAPTITVNQHAKLNARYRAKLNAHCGL